METKKSKFHRETEMYTVRMADNGDAENPYLLAEVTKSSEINGKPVSSSESHAYPSPEHFTREAMFMVREGYLSDMMIDKGSIKTLHVTIIVEYRDEPE